MSEYTEHIEERIAELLEFIEAVCPEGLKKEVSLQYLKGGMHWAVDSLESERLYH